MISLRELFTGRAKGAAPENYLRARDVQLLVDLYAPAGEVTTKSVGDPAKGDYATYTFDSLSDGKNLTLDMKSRVKGVDYSTSLKAEIVAEGTLKVTSLVFDNHVEPLTNAKEIFSVLDWIGNFQTNWIGRGQLPWIHEEKGEFGKVGRFLKRHLPTPKGDGFWG